MQGDAMTDVGRVFSRRSPAISLRGQKALVTGASSGIGLVPYQRIGEPQDIAAVAVFLASDLADYINGASIFVDGGMTLYPAFAAGA